MENEIWLFGIGICAGGCLALVFDFGRAFRKEIRHNGFFIAVEDIVFWIFAGVFLFSLIEKYNKGVLRFYIFLGCILGALVYGTVFHKLIFSVFCFIFHILFLCGKKLCEIAGIVKSFLKKLIYYPLKNIVKKFTILLRSI